MKEKLIVFNWKMNPAGAKEARLLGTTVKKTASHLRKTQVVIAPPDIFLPLLQAKKASRRWSLGAQNLSEEAETGAYTGEISAAMLATVGAKYVIVGHSERRAKGETDNIIKNKTKNALAAGLKAILCLGEKARDAHGGYLDILRNQLLAIVRDFNKSDFKNLLVAYEPVWAIGEKALTADTPDGFLHNALFIRKIFNSVAGQEAALNLPVLYGGSVKSDNAENFLTGGRADGLLVGGSSLDPNEVKAILTITDKIKTKK